MSGFNDIIGQEQIKDHLKNAIEQDKVSHAYIICGEKYSGKKFISKIFATALLCEGDEVRPCGKCHSCLQAAGDNNPDIIYVTHEKPNIIGVDDIRTQVNSDINIKPYAGKRKIYVISEAEKMNQQAQNAILKTFEEPPEYAVILLLVTNTEVLLPTIRSRAVTLNMKPVKDDLLRDFLMENAAIPEYKADVCVAFSRGNVGKALLLAKSDDFENLKNDVLGFLKRIKAMSAADVGIMAKKASENKENVEDFLDLILVWYRDCLLYKTTGQANNLIFKEELQYINKVTLNTSYEGIEDIFNAIEMAKRRITSNVNLELTLELLFLEIQEK